MNIENRKKQEINLIQDENITYRDSLNNQKLLLRTKENNLNIKIKRKGIIEQINSNFNYIPKEQQIHINKLETSFNTIISYLKSSNNDLISHCLNHLVIYFKYNEPTINEQKLIIEGQFFKILLNLGNKFIYEKNVYDLIQIIWILMNIQLFNEGNNDYLKIIYGEEYMEFYNECFCKMDSDEIVSEIIALLNHIIQINSEISIIIFQSKVFNSIIYYTKNKILDMFVKEMIIKLIVNCLNKYDNLNENEVSIINDCIIILKNTLDYFPKERIQLLCYEGLYKISKIDNKYNFNEILIKEKIPFQILNMKEFNNNNLLIKILKILGNILTVSDNDCKSIYEKNIIEFYNNILNMCDDDDKIIKIILISIFNISDSKYRYIIQDSIIWLPDKIQKYLNKNEQITLIFLKIIKQIINNANYNTLKFIYNTKIIEYLIFMLSKGNLNENVKIKMVKVIDNYLKKFQDSERKNTEYYLIFMKFHDLIKLNVINKID